MTQISHDSPFSFDEQGKLSVRNGVAIRRINGNLALAVERLRSNNGMDALCKAGMIQTEVGTSGPITEVRHEFIPFVSYPQEWTLKMLQQAALCALDVAIELNRHDLALQDPHAWNVSFRFGRPVYIDFSSIIHGKKLHPRFLHDIFKSYYIALWLGGQKYGVRKFQQLAHAVMNSEHEWRMWQQPRSEWRRMFDDDLLGRFCREYNQIVRRHQGDEDPIQLLKALRKHIASIDIVRQKSQWSEYGQPGGSYDDPSSFSTKARAVAELLGHLPPGRLLDLACNQGWFTGYAAKLGHVAMGLDADPIAVDTGLAAAQQAKFDIAHMNVAWPTPPQGAFLMYPSAYERFSCDTVMMIALQHHLNLRQGIRFEALAAMAARYGAKNLLIEWIPPDDVIVKDWLVKGNLTHVPEWYNEAAFEAAMQGPFPLMERIESGEGHAQFPEATPRKMYLFRKAD